MIDREYVKLNTSINTATNSNQLLQDEEGNLEACIELLLPDNLFDNNAATRRIERVDMQTSKMRLSLENTPIAEVPLDTDLTSGTTLATTCQLDVYPYCLLDDSNIAPSVGSSSLAFPHYKNHDVDLEIYAQTTTTGTPTLLESFNLKVNTTGVDAPPRNSRFYDFFIGLQRYIRVNHVMNMCAQTNHEPFQTDGDKLLISHIGTLEQMLQDAIENAITYASTSSAALVKIYLVPIDSPDLSTMSPKPTTSLTIYLDEYGKDYCYWKYEIAASSAHCFLKHACKPSVRINEQSISISYDTAAFDEIIPIFWNTPYVNTYDIPEQLTIDKLRSLTWHQPPPKRVYKYGAAVASDDPHTFDFTYLENLKCSVMNLIANRALRDTFSYLPWIRVDMKSIPQFSNLSNLYHTEIVTSKRTETQVRLPFSLSYLTYYYVESQGASEPVQPYQYLQTRYITPIINNHYVINYSYDVLPEYEENQVYEGNNYSYRINQRTDYGNIRTGAVVGSLESPQPMPSTSGVNIGMHFTSSTSSSVVESYDSPSSARQPGIYTVDLPPTTEDIEVENQLLPTNPPNVGKPAYYEKVYCYYEEVSDQERAYVLGVIPQGDWDSSVLMEERFLPPRPMDVDNVSTVVIDGKTYNHHEGYWEVPIAEQVGTQWYIARYTKIQIYGTYDGVNTTTTTNTTTVTSRPQGDNTNRIELTPNLAIPNDEFYILDGTSAEVTIGSPELIAPQDPEESYLFNIHTEVSRQHYEGTRSDEYEEGDNPMPTDTPSDITYSHYFAIGFAEGPTAQDGNICYEYKIYLPDSDHTTRQQQKVLVCDVASPPVLKPGETVESPYLLHQTRNEVPTGQPDITTTDEGSNDESLTPGTTTTERTIDQTETFVSSDWGDFVHSSYENGKFLSRWTPTSHTYDGDPHWIRGKSLLHWGYVDDETTQIWFIPDPDVYPPSSHEITVDPGDSNWEIHTLMWHGFIAFDYETQEPNLLKAYVQDYVYNYNTSYNLVQTSTTITSNTQADLYHVTTVTKPFKETGYKDDYYYVGSAVSPVSSATIPYKGWYATGISDGNDKCITFSYDYDSTDPDVTKENCIVSVSTDSSCTIDNPLVSTDNPPMLKESHTIWTSHQYLPTTSTETDTSSPTRQPGIYSSTGTPEMTETYVEATPTGEDATGYYYAFTDSGAADGFKWVRGREITDTSYHWISGTFGHIIPDVTPSAETDVDQGNNIHHVTMKWTGFHVPQDNTFNNIKHEQKICVMYDYDLQKITPYVTTVVSKYDAEYKVVQVTAKNRRTGRRTREDLTDLTTDDTTLAYHYYKVSPGTMDPTDPGTWGIKYQHATAPDGSQLDPSHGWSMPTVKTSTIISTGPVIRLTTTEPYSERTTWTEEITQLPSESYTYYTDNPPLPEGTTSTAPTTTEITNAEPSIRYRGYRQAGFFFLPGGERAEGLSIVEYSSLSEAEEETMVDTVAFLNIIPKGHEATCSYSRLSTDGTFIVYQDGWQLDGSVDYNVCVSDLGHVKVESTELYETSSTTTTAVTRNPKSSQSIGANVRLTFTWSNLPMVVMSPIQSIVLTLEGVQVAQEYQPINMTTVGGSSLTSSIPVIENFYSMAQSLRDLHDELVVAKESFDDTATYALDTKGGMQRVMRLRAKYITKDGRLHQIYIPPNGVFSLQLTFGLSFYTTS